jgi:hypothetical protein
VKIMLDFYEAAEKSKDSLGIVLEDHAPTTKQ